MYELTKPLTKIVNIDGKECVCAIEISKLKVLTQDYIPQRFFG